MADGDSQSNRPLKMVECGRCKARIFIPADLAAFQTEACSKCGHPVMVPVMLHNFELRGVIASGGMGTVFTAWDSRLQRKVAVKMMKREVVADEQVLQAFYREARASAALNHTNIIHIYSFDEWEGQPYIAMELADSGSVDSRIETEGRLPELDVLDVGIKIASALDTALKHNLLHRDIKPGNILYNEEREPKLADFGLARAAENAAGYEEHVYGTVYYIAPEKVTHQPETFLSDMYSLGGTLYHAITGHPPFEASTVEGVVAAQVQTPLTPPILVVPEITEPTSNALCRSLAKDPRERFPTYDDMRMDLEMARSMVLREKALRDTAAAEGEGHGGRSWWRR